MYAYGASAALILSFVVLGLSSDKSKHDQLVSTTDLTKRTKQFQFPPILLRTLQFLSVILFLLTISSGLFGNQNSYVNFNMTFFWIIVVLAFTYVTALVGNLYQFINPWRVIFDEIRKYFPSVFKERKVLNPSWGCYPALLFYMVFIWLELFAHTTPYSLSIAIIFYTLLNFIGSCVFGVNSWFRSCEFFGLFFRLIGMMAPVKYRYIKTSRGAKTISATLRMPFIGLLEEEAPHISVVIFILFMLSSTAYDSLHHTEPWSRLFWVYLYPLLDSIIQLSSSQPYVLAAKIFGQWQMIALFMSPFAYLIFYLGSLFMTMRMIRSELSLLGISLRFAYSLVPIAFVYHFTHYYTLLLSQGLQIFNQIFDPFGFGWNVFGNKEIKIEPFIINTSYIWHTQVGLILIGHIVSVYLAHIVALKMFHTGTRAMVNQLPMLFFMVGLTAGGLWIMSLPLVGG